MQTILSPLPELGWRQGWVLRLAKLAFAPIFVAAPMLVRAPEPGLPQPAERLVKMQAVVQTWAWVTAKQ